MTKALLLFLLFIASTSHAQPGLKWEVDTVTISQAGCRSWKDSVIVNFTNTSSAPIAIDNITGLGGRWEVVNATQYDDLVVAPGAVYTVKVLYAPSGPQFNVRPLYLRLKDGSTADTLFFREDLTLAYLSGQGWDFQYFNSKTPVGTTQPIYEIWFAATGNAPVVINEVWTAGDSSITVVRTGPDTLLPGPLGTQLPTRLHFTYSPIESGNDTTTVYLRTTGLCDSIYKFTLALTAAIPAPSAMHWTRDQINLSSRCGGVASATISLRNSSQVESFVDSIRVIDDKTGLFSLGGQGTSGFVLPPATVIDYSVQFTPSAELNVLHDAVLVAYASDGGTDSIYLAGITYASSGRADDSLFDLGNTYVRTNWDQYSKIYGMGNFVLSEIRIDGPMTVTVSEIKSGDVVSQWGTRVFYTVTADAPGPQITTVTFLGAECDTPIVITFKGDFQEWPSSVQHESPVEAAKWDGRSITFSRFPTNVLIYDVLGRLIQTIVQPAAKLDLSHLQPGIYVINWEDERGSAAIRIHRQQ